MGEELRKANTQRELCNIQRRLATLHRRAQEPDAGAGLGPKLLNVSKWVKAEALQQEEHLAAGKTKDGKVKLSKDAQSESLAGDMHSERDASSSSSMPGPSQPSSKTNAQHAASEVDLLVDCLGCEQPLPWHELATFDGLCSSCAIKAAELVQSTEDPESSFEGAPQLGKMTQLLPAVEPKEEELQPQQFRSKWRGKRSNKSADA